MNHHVGQKVRLLITLAASVRQGLRRLMTMMIDTVIQSSLSDVMYRTITVDLRHGRGQGQGLPHEGQRGKTPHILLMHRKDVV